MRSGRARHPRGLSVTLLVLALALSGCTTVGAALAQPAPTPAATSSKVTRVAVVGDSITAALSPDFASGDVDPGSWVHEVMADDRAVFAGGWAVWGATTADMRAGVRPVDADVLVLLAGSNDVEQGVPFATTAANLEAIARIVGGRRVVVAGIPPIDADPGDRAAFNVRLEAFVRAQGWTWVPPVAAIESDGRFSPGLSDDGEHPTPEGAQLIGQAIRGAVLAPAAIPAG